MEEGIKREELNGEDDEKWVRDSSVDYNGNIPLRASTGVWRASIFIIAIDFCERMSYFALATSLIIYLTKVIKQDLKTAAKSVNDWQCVTTLMPLLGGFLADAYLGRFSTVFLSSIVYLMGLMLLTMSRLIPGLRPCNAEMCQEPRRIHEVIFFLAIYLISIGTGGHKPSLQSFGADQFDDSHIKERKKKMSFFNWWSVGLCSGLLLSVTLVVYVQDHFGWGTADITLTAVMALSLVILLVGRPFYRYRKPNGSPLTPMLQVLVAAIAKRNLPYPSSAAELYEVSQTTQGRLLGHTEKLKFLDKAAILTNEENLVEKQSPWKLATVTKVEEVKLVVNVIPIWLTCLPFGICVAQTLTFFIKQGTMMNRKIRHDFLLPPASIYAINAIGMIISVTIYDKILMPLLRKATGNERGINILQRIGTGMIFSVAAMVIAALVEKKRLSLVENSPSKSSLSMSVFWLAPQFFIMGFGDGFTLVGLQEYFYDQVPDSMRSLGIALYLSVLGASFFLSSLLITVVDHATEKGGKSWFGKDLNSSRLDKFYWLLAAITAGNLCMYVFLAQHYSYKSVQMRKATVAADQHKGDNLESKV
ncbi:hypothetical protein Nepgr_024903 [Nepenthes gracilis]|uniref:Uncharacterized protein n=1 Tax=Nepenthes gracilis TaxID=150966 RepID=A0AAD3T423_NEPGR|nr:hypothetical protein Nepgr_024903 [Nepenthes gracilis]